jgi:peptidoglycan/xylan/chitin deacetylase (PgdA/CDA1 family)
MIKIKQSIRQTSAMCVSSITPLSLLKRMSMNIPIIGYYHIINDEKVPHLTHLYAYKNVKQFKDDLDFILRKFSPLSLLDFLDHLKTGQSFPNDSFFLTFDDGLREVSDIIAPILLEKGIPGTFFVSSAFTDNHKMAHDHKASLIVEHLRRAGTRSMERSVWDIITGRGYLGSNVENCILGINYQHCGILNEIAEKIGLDFQMYLTETKPYVTTVQLKNMIKQGFAIGAHGVDHPLYSNLSLEQQLIQTKVSMNFIREKFDLNYGAFAFPHSDYGVAKEFFTKMEKYRLMDISFGTAGIMKDSEQNHFQRFSLERPILPAKKIISYQLARGFYQIIRGHNKINR